MTLGKRESSLSTLVGQQLGRAETVLLREDRKAPVMPMALMGTSVDRIKFHTITLCTEMPVWASNILCELQLPHPLVTKALLA